MKNKKFPKFYYVYIVTNLILNKQYVGSRICYKDKIEDDNYWGSSKYLNEDYIIYGMNNFTKEIITAEYTNAKNMLEGESYYIHKYNTLSPNGYNRFDPILRKGFHTIGLKYSKETKEKHFNGINNPMYGKTVYDIWVEKFGKEEADKKNQLRSEKLSKSHIDKKHNETTKKKIGKANKGRSNINKGKTGVYFHTEETKIKMRKPKSEKGRLNIRLAKQKNPCMKGKKHREDSKKKMSDSLKKVEKICCIYCNKYFFPWHYVRYHGDNCKFKTEYINKIN
jgi:group I intron endonuclease